MRLFEFEARRVVELAGIPVTKYGHATSADIEGLGEEVRRRVAESQGVTLEWEIKRVGRW